MPKYVGGYATRQRTNQQIANGVSSALMAVAQGFAERERKQNDEQIIEKMNDPELSEVQRAQLAMKLSPQGQKSVLTTLELYRKLAHQQEQERQHQEEVGLRREREERLKSQNSSKDLERSYKGRLTDIKEQLKDTYDPKARKLLQDEQKSLQKELGQNLARLKRGERPRFEALQIEEDTLPVNRRQIDTENQMGAGPNQNIPGATPGIRPNEMPEQQMQGNAPQAQATQVQRQKVRWDKTNPEHAAFAAKVYQDTGGDRAKTNAILAEQFER